MSESVTAFAPASIGNVGVGFDMLGLALAGGAGDRVIASRRDEPGIAIEEVRGLDGEIDALYRDAAKQGKRLRYVARFDAGGKASVGLEAVDTDHPFCNINLTDNIVQFKSDRYSANPLVVQGPGAGPEITAQALLGDVLALG